MHFTAPSSCVNNEWNWISFQIVGVNFKMAKEIKRLTNTPKVYSFRSLF